MGEIFVYVCVYVFPLYPSSSELTDGTSSQAVFVVDAWMWRGVHVVARLGNGRGQFGNLLVRRGSGEKRKKREKKIEGLPGLAEVFSIRALYGSLKF